MDSASQSVLVALPSYNEELAIEKVIREIRSNVAFPLIVVDGHSTDKTTEIANSLEVEVVDRTAGKGYGCAVQKALEIAVERGFDWLFIIDCDLTYRADEMLKLVSHSKGNDLVVGIRPMQRISFSHRLANRSHNILVSFLHKQRVADINSGMRMLRVSKYTDRLTERNMGMVAQISSIALRNGWSVKEVPIEYDKRIGKSKIDMLDWFVITWTIVRERFANRRK